MIFHPIVKLRNAGIHKIMIVTGTEHMGDVMTLLGSGVGRFGCDFTYRVQDEAGGIAQALALAEDFVQGERVVVILGDNVFEDPLRPYVDEFVLQSEGARVLLSSVKDPHRFGVPCFGTSGISRIEEKPVHSQSNYAVTGIYFYDSRVFDIIRGLKPSARGEYEITDVNNAYASKGILYHSILKGWWTDAGTFESLAQANILVGKGR
jgi:glucose-1-phosphate thymidylyltransferase